MKHGKIEIKKTNPFYSPAGSKSFDLILVNEKRKVDDKMQSQRVGPTCISSKLRRVSRRELLNYTLDSKERSIVEC
jgi:hypothetical protein